MVGATRLGRPMLSLTTEDTESAEAVIEPQRQEGQKNELVGMKWVGATFRSQRRVMYNGKALTMVGHPVVSILYMIGMLNVNPSNLESDSSFVSHVATTGSRLCAQSAIEIVIASSRSDVDAAWRFSQRTWWAEIVPWFCRELQCVVLIRGCSLPIFVCSAPSASLILPPQLWAFHILVSKEVPMVTCLECTKLITLVSVFMSSNFVDTRRSTH